MGPKWAMEPESCGWTGDKAGRKAAADSPSPGPKGKTSAEPGPGGRQGEAA